MRPVNVSRKRREAAIRGRAKQAMQARQRRRLQVERALTEAGGHFLNLTEIASAAGRTPAVVRDALAEMEGVERDGRMYRIPAPQHQGEGDRRG